MANYWFLLDQWPGIILAFALYFWFWSYRTHTQNEIEILDTLYPEGRSPSDWDKITNKRIVRYLAVGIVLVFMLLAALLQHPSLFALIMLALSCQDIIGNEILRDNLRRTFSDFDCNLPPDDPRCELYNGRQLAARHYWLDRPQLLRIAIMMIATVAILAFSLLPLSFAAQTSGFGLTMSLTATLTVLALACIIVANEFVMRRWRAARDDELLSVEIAFDEAMSARATAAAGPTESLEAKQD
ncbi:MAG: hypothetical protein J0L76_12430 [Rhodobacterales bacterium]|nr:hypothetical protein [Rhodobacterales bacterium]